jgi:hypothetical protein
MPDPKLVVQKIIHELGGSRRSSRFRHRSAGVDDGPTRAKDIREGPRRPEVDWSTGISELTAIGAVEKKGANDFELDEAMEAGFEEDVPYVCDLEEGDKVVHPHHGAGIVLKKEP